MQTAKLTINLDKSEIDFLKKYAKKSGSTISEIIDQFVKNLKREAKPNIHPKIKEITGIIPPDIDAKAEYAEYILKKHQ